MSEMNDKANFQSSIQEASGSLMHAQLQLSAAQLRLNSELAAYTARYSQFKVGQSVWCIAKNEVVTITYVSAVEVNSLSGDTFMYNAYSDSGFRHCLYQHQIKEIPQ